MNIGTLYKVKQYFWLLFPTKDDAATPTAERLGIAAAAVATTTTAAAAAYWSERYSCNVTYFSPDCYIVFLEEEGKLKKVLTSEGLIGWTWFDESYNHCFEEVTP